MTQRLITLLKKNSQYNASQQGKLKSESSLSNCKISTQTLQTKKSHCHIPYFVQAFPRVENGGLNLVLQLSKPLTYMTVT